MIYESEVKIKEIIPRTHNVKSFRLDLLQDINFKAGQFLIVRLKTGKNLSRALSISSSPTEKGYIEFTKKITENDFSQVLDKLNIGDSVFIKYPYGSFVYDSEYRKIAILSGGIGITPVRSIIKCIVDKKMDTDIVLLYGNRSEGDIVFRADFDEMRQEFIRFKLIHVLSEPGAGWQGKIGRINLQIIKEEISDYIERKFYICGPPLMVKALSEILTVELSLPVKNIILEKFSGY